MRYIVWIMLIAVIASSAYGQSVDKFGVGVTVPQQDRTQSMTGIDKQIGFATHGSLAAYFNPSFAAIFDSSILVNGVETSGFADDGGFTIVHWSSNLGVMYKTKSQPALYGFAAPGFSYVMHLSTNDETGAVEIDNDEYGYNILIGAGIVFPRDESVGFYVEGRYSHTFFGDSRALTYLFGLSFVESM